MNKQDQINGLSMDITAENKAKLKELFPNVFNEDEIDFDKLKAELGNFTENYENRRERYGMDWPGKKDVLKLIQTRSAATLKPCREESVNFDSTENLFIEGDNLEVLKLLQKSYYGKVKMIYIDPPYNTGKEFIYPDNYSESLDTYLEYAGLVDSTGKKFSTNLATEGRFHTKWLNMMYPRLYLARNLLRDDGVIFISIHHKELYNLLNLCNEIYGEENLAGILTWKARVKPVNIGDSKYRPQLETENVVVYKKTNIDGSFYPLITGGIRTYPHSDSGRKYRLTTILKSNRGVNYRSTMSFELEGFMPPEGQRWQAGEDVIKQLFKDGYIEFKDGTPFKRYYEDEEGAEHDPFYCFMDIDWTSTSEAGKNELNDLLGNNHGFDTVKPVTLLRTLTMSCTRENDLVVDFFAGSGTTAHAVLDLNKQDGGNRKFIMVQLPEKCDPDSEAYKAGYKTIADIGKERIRRVIKKLNEEDNGKLDLDGKTKQDRGFKVLKLDKTNFKQWERLSPETPTDEIVKQMELMTDRVNHTATEEDLLFEIIIKAGLSPTQPINKLTLAGLTVYSLESGLFMICLAPEVTQELFDAVAAAKPARFICFDTAFKGNDKLKANASQTFKAMNTGKDKFSQIVFEVI